ncbi:MAG: flavodoxin family protein [Promethearchaeota archaeon]
MKVAVLFDSKFGNTKQLAEFFAEQVEISGHEVQLFRTKETKPESLLTFEPDVILVGGPTHGFGTARTLTKYIKKLGVLIKKSTSSKIVKAAVFNCYNNRIVCQKIEKNLVNKIPNVNIYEKSHPVKTGGLKGPLPEDWETAATIFIKGFINFFSLDIHK